jgi:hypothetical protein
MKDLALFLLKSLVSKPEEVVVEEIPEDGGVKLKAKVAEADKGKVIGRDGKVIKAVRTVLSAGAAKQNKRVVLDLE